MTTLKLTELQNEYLALPKEMKGNVRRVATRELVLNHPELEEIGSSDVSIAMFNLRDELGSWEEVLRYGVQHFKIQR